MDLRLLSCGKLWEKYIIICPLVSEGENRVGETDRPRMKERVLGVILRRLWVKQSVLVLIAPIIEVNPHSSCCLLILLHEDPEKLGNLRHGIELG